MSRTRKPPVITSPHGITTESARRQCASNMAADPEVKKRVEDALIAMYGADKGLAIARERYYECYEESK
jgi:hypothetical protein